jgi:hypothetical protein
MAKSKFSDLKAAQREAIRAVANLMVVNKKYVEYLDLDIEEKKTKRGQEVLKISNERLNTARDIEYWDIQARSLSSSVRTMKKEATALESRNGPEARDEYVELSDLLDQMNAKLTFLKKEREKNVRILSEKPELGTTEAEHLEFSATLEVVPGRPQLTVDQELVRAEQSVENSIAKLNAAEVNEGYKRKELTREEHLVASAEAYLNRDVKPGRTSLSKAQIANRDANLAQKEIAFIESGEARKERLGIEIQSYIRQIKSGSEPKHHGRISFSLAENLERAHRNRIESLQQAIEFNEVDKSFTEKQKKAITSALVEAKAGLDNFDKQADFLAAPEHNEILLACQSKLATQDSVAKDKLLSEKDATNLNKLLANVKNNKPAALKVRQANVSRKAKSIRRRKQVEKGEDYQNELSQYQGAG